MPAAKFDFYSPNDDSEVEAIFRMADKAGLDLDGFLRAFPPNTFAMIEEGKLFQFGWSGLFFDHPYAFEAVYRSLLKDHGEALASKQGNSCQAMADMHDVIRQLANCDWHPSGIGERARIAWQHSIALTRQSMDAGEWRQASASLCHLVVSDIACAEERDSKPLLDSELLALLVRLREAGQLARDRLTEIANAILLQEKYQHLLQLREAGIDLELPVLGISPLYQAIGEQSCFAPERQHLQLFACNGGPAFERSPLAIVIDSGACLEEEFEPITSLVEKVKILLEHDHCPAHPDGINGDALRAAIDRQQIWPALALLQAGANPELVGTPRASLRDIMADIDAKQGQLFMLDALDVAKVVDLNRYPIAEVAPYCRNAKRLSVVMRTHRHATELPGYLKGSLATKAMDLIVNPDTDEMEL